MVNLQIKKDKIIKNIISMIKKKIFLILLVTFISIKVAYLKALNKINIFKNNNIYYKLLIFNRLSEGNLKNNKFSIIVLFIVYVANFILVFCIKTNLLVDINYYLIFSLLVESLVGYIYLGIYKRLFGYLTVIDSFTFILVYSILKTNTFLLQTAFPIYFIWGYINGTLFTYIIFLKRKSFIF